MYNLIQRYMNNLSIEQVRGFAIKNNVSLSEQELLFTYQFVKKNWEQILSNPNMLKLERYRNQFSEENYKKIERLIAFYYQKYGHLL